LLDGELVYNFRYEKHCFLIHDAIWVNERSVAHLPLSQRLAAIGAYVTGPIRQKYPTIADEHFYPFAIMGKEVLEFPHVSELISYSKYFVDEVGPRFVYDRNRRYYDTEGLYFIRESLPYSPHALLSWKYPELETVTFRVTIAALPSGTHFHSSVRLPGQSTLVQYRSINFHRDQSSAILNQVNGAVEASLSCRFDAKSGEWVFLFVADQAISDLTHVLQHVESVASRVKQSEIERCAHSVLMSTRTERREDRVMERDSRMVDVSPKNASPLLLTPDPSASPMSASPEVFMSSKRERVDERLELEAHTGESLKKRRVTEEGIA
jgi:hypothetical protein